MNKRILTILFVFLMSISFVFAINNTNETVPVNDTPNIIINESNQTLPINNSEPIINNTPILENQTLINETNQTIPVNESLPTNQTTPINETLELNQTINKTIKIVLKYGDNPSFDYNNDGIEELYGAVDFTVKTSKFNWNVNEENLCTRWETASLDNQTSAVVCYGSPDCCAFVNLQASPEAWNDNFFAYYGLHGATTNNEVSAQVIYVNFSLDVKNLYSEIYYSDWETLQAIFEPDKNNIFTKIKDFIVDKISAIRGDIVRISAKLVYENESPVPFKKVDLYANKTLVDSKLTDISGNVVFDLDTSPIIPDQYLINLTFPGQTTIIVQETINFMPSSDFSFITVKTNETSVNLTEPEVEPAKEGNYHLTTRDTAWKILKKDYITEYVDYNFVYVNDTHYRVDWEWNDDYVKDVLNSCVDLNGNQQEACIRDISVDYLDTKEHALTSETADYLSYDDFRRNASKECSNLNKQGKLNCRKDAAQTHFDKINPNINKFSNSYFPKKNFGIIRQDFNYLKLNDMPKQVVGGNAKILGIVNPLQKDRGSFYIELEDGFKNSNGLQIEWGLDSVLAEFNNSNTIENLTFTEKGDVIRYLELPKDTSISSATIDLKGYRTDDYYMSAIEWTFNDTDQIRTIWPRNKEFLIDEEFIYGSFDTISDIFSNENFTVINKTDGNVIWYTNKKMNCITGDDTYVYATEPTTNPNGRLRKRYKSNGTVIYTVDEGSVQSNFSDTNCAFENGSGVIYFAHQGGNGIDPFGSWLNEVDKSTGHINQKVNLSANFNTNGVDLASDNDFLYWGDINFTYKVNKSSYGINWTYEFPPRSGSIIGLDTVEVDNDKVYAFNDNNGNGVILNKSTGANISDGHWFFHNIILPEAESDYLYSRYRKWDRSGNLIQNLYLDGINNNDNELYAIAVEPDTIMFAVYNDTLISKIQKQFPNNLTIKTNDTQVYQNLSEFNGTTTVDLNITLLQSCVDTCAEPSGDNCLCAINFSSATSGTLEYSNINIIHNSPPTFSVNTTENSTSTDTTNRGDFVTFNATIADVDNDDVKLMVCDDSGRTGAACIETEYCNSGLQTPSATSCQFNTSSLTNVEYNWTSFACDNSSVCTDGLTGTFFITRPRNPIMYVNGTEVWNYSGLFDGPETIENFTNELQNGLDACSPTEDSCNISLTFSSDDEGKLELSVINIQYGLYDTEPPVINGVAADPNPIPLNSSVNITVNATDNANVSSVHVSLGQEEANLTYNAITDLWSATLMSPSSVGVYQLNTTALDASNLSANDLQEITWVSNASGCVGICASAGDSGSSLSELIIYSTDISYSPINPSQNENVTINVTVYNLGGGAANNFEVELQVDDVHQTFNTMSLENYSSNITTFYWNATAGNQTIKIVADYLDELNEDNETNNEGTTEISVTDLTPPSVLNILTERGSLIIKLNITDNVNVSSVTAIVNTTTIPFSYNSTSALWEGSSEEINPGTYAIEIIVIDVSGLTTTTRSIITVYEEAIDITLNKGDLLFSSAVPSDGENLVISANVYNYGVNETVNFTVELLVDNVSQANNTVSVPGDSNLTTQFNWIANYGNHTITAKIDPKDSVSEFNESNNELTKSIFVEDVTAPTINEVMLPKIIYENSALTIRANVTENVNISKVNASINSAELILVFNATSNLYENTTTSPAAGTYTLEVMALDVNNLSSTLQENIIIYESGTDITFGIGDIQLLPENVSETNQLNISVAISNKGGTDANNFKVELLIDGASTQNNTHSVEKAASNITQFTWTAVYDYHNLTIRIDPDNSIAEYNETNNEKNRTFFVLDITPPSPVSLTASPPNWTNQTTHNISWSAVSDTNGINKYEYTIDDGDWTNNGLETSFTTPPQDDGIHNISVRAVDNPGNIANSSEIKIYVDTAGPNTPVIKEWHSGDNWTQHNTPYLTWEDPGDEGSGITIFAISVDDEETNLSYNLSYHSSNLTSGSHTFKVRAYDALNQASNWSNTVTVYIDTSLPDSPLISSSTHPDNTTWYSVNVPLFEITNPSEDSGIHGYYYVFDETHNTTPDIKSLWTNETTINLTNFGGGIQIGVNGTNSTNESNVADGEWYLHVIEKDNVGNVAANVTHYKIQIDTTTPSVDNLTPGNNTTPINNSPTIVVNYSDIHAGVNISAVILTLDGSDITGGSSVSSTSAVYNATSLSNGVHEASINITDNAGNNIFTDWTFSMDEDLEITSFDNLDLNLTKAIFEAVVDNILPNININDINWTLDANDGNTVMGSDLINLTANASASIFVEHNYSQTGDYNVKVNVTNGSYMDEKILILDVQDIEVSDLIVLNSSDAKRIFEFNVTNKLAVSVGNVSWQFDTKNNLLINSTTNVTLDSEESSSVLIEYNFSSAGTYNVNATATNGSLTDSLSLSVTI